MLEAEQIKEILDVMYERKFDIEKEDENVREHNDFPKEISSELGLKRSVQLDMLLIRRRNINYDINRIIEILIK